MCRATYVAGRRRKFFSESFVSENNYDKMKKKIVSHMINSGGSLTRSELSNNIKAKNLREKQDAIKDLIDSGIIRAEKKGNLVTYKVI